MSGPGRGRRIFYIAGALVLAWATLLVVVRLASGPRGNLGAAGGRLADCPSSPNCVSSQAGDPGHRVAALRFEGPPDAAMNALVAALGDVSGIRVVARSATYVHAEARTTFLRFVDDLEFLMDPEERVIHVRSASRLGHSDLGVNRRRVEKIRARFSGPASG